MKRMKPVKLITANAIIRKGINVKESNGVLTAPVDPDVAAPRKALNKERINSPPIARMAIGTITSIKLPTKPDVLPVSNDILTLSKAIWWRVGISFVHFN